jgi:EF-P beta-lysylation protein EpmB
MKPVMIPPDDLQEHPLQWKTHLKSSATPAPSLQCHNILDDYIKYLETGPKKQTFPLRLPHAFVERMQKQDDWQSILRQFIPSESELHSLPGYAKDPVSDTESIMAAGILHKYQGRVLIITTGICPVHCRYCFRKNFSYAELNSERNHYHQAIKYVKNHTQIHEVILSGGDPLSLMDEPLFELIDDLQEIRHVTTLRIHTRYPVIIPERITNNLCANFKARIKNIRFVLVLHSNHPGEIDQSTTEAIAKLLDCGITVLNQSVLLKGVNDSTAILTALSLRLHKASVLPYYLHMLDPVNGSHHFAIDDLTALRLHEDLRNFLPGYLVPRLVREVPGKPSKQLISRAI